MIDQLCETCTERFKVPGERHCGNCLMYVEEIDDRACDACGSQTFWDGSCGCDLPPASDPYWMRK